VCAPVVNDLLEEIDQFSNVRVIYTKKKGQVYQRSVGFKSVETELVLQMDDDVIFERDAIKRLIHCLENIKGKASIAPSFFWTGTTTLTYAGNYANFLRKITDWIANGSDGRIPGIISLSGVNFGLNFNVMNKNIHKTEWLSGGCILHRAADLIVEDYFPFSGKAYAEDLIHSFLLKEQGVELFVCEAAIAYIDKEPYSTSLSEFYKQYKASKYAAILWEKNLTRLNIYFVIKFITANFLKILKR